ncbi:MAG TPA: hypothetical protein VFI17_05045 [Solirubrobacterales bacterium]|nr:hypothetical protein [Solirubrobacterales bacterium]
MRQLSALTVALLLLAGGILAAGCGEDGAAAGATISVYVAAPLCKEARQQLRRESGRVGDLRVRPVCLASVEAKGGADLARAGANARRATEDSTAVAFLEAPGPAAKFSAPIVESADIGWATATSGAAAMRRVLLALAEGDPNAPRTAVREVLNEAS